MPEPGSAAGRLPGGLPSALGSAPPGPLPALTTRYGAASRQLTWRWWDDSCVVHDASTARIHRLDQVAAQALQLFSEHGAMDGATLFTRLFPPEPGDVTDAPISPQEHEALADVLQQLLNLELLELAPA